MSDDTNTNVSEPGSGENSGPSPAAETEAPQPASGQPAGGETAPAGEPPADGAAEVLTPDQVLRPVELKPAASVGPVVPGRGRGRSRGDHRGRGRGREEPDEGGVESSVIRIYRCSKVVKGGRTFSFAALVVAGDRNGQIGWGYGKANEVPSAVEKATKEARKTMFSFPIKGSTIPHIIIGKSGSSRVKLIPALPGTGVTAGKTVRPVLELAGLTDVLTKAYGSTSPKNLLKATIDALRRLQSSAQVAKGRGVKLEAGAGELAGAATQ